ncbi:hypothetical protein AGMMS49521_1660 [Campylobacterota bacterium]|nr:hypothetical protein AGMMS49521_1660 [Campylobacterota bacterium]
MRKLDYIVKTGSLSLKNVVYRIHSIVGIYDLGDEIVYVHLAMENIPPEEVTTNTILSEYIIVDSFSPDFGKHTQKYLTLPKVRGTSHFRRANCYFSDGHLFINTMYYKLPNYDPAGLAKVYDLSGEKIECVGDSPKPIDKVLSDGKDYIFGDYIVRMASEFKMECRSAAAGTQIWNLRLTAYLYTEIEEHNGFIYFGTAGKGGHFYCVSLDDGAIKFDLNNGDTVRFAWFNGNILITNKKGELLLIDPKNGEVLEQINFGKLKMNDEDPILIAQNKIYGVVYNKLGRQAACIEHILM